MIVEGIGFGAVVGLSLGLTGSGGSILAVPLLVYGMGIPVREAIFLSLAIVGLIALTGAIRQGIARQVDWAAAVLFAVTGAVVSPIVLHFAAAMDQGIRLSLFAGVMVLAAAKIAFPQMGGGHWEAPKDGRSLAHKALGGGVVAGALAGLFGIGGGFVIVPLLVSLLHIPYRRAVGTSLAIIFLISVSSIGFGLLSDTPVDWRVLGLFALGGFAGMVAGTALVRHLPDLIMRRAFAVIVLGMGVWILFDRLWLQSGRV